jgi:hypothetical protein
MPSLPRGQLKTHRPRQSLGLLRSLWHRNSLAEQPYRTVVSG